MITDLDRKKKREELEKRNAKIESNYFSKRTRNIKDVRMKKEGRVRY